MSLVRSTVSGESADGLGAGRGGDCECVRIAMESGKEGMRREMLVSLSAKAQRPVVYCNAVGGNDELVFDGGSLALNAQGKVLAAGARLPRPWWRWTDGPVQSEASRRWRCCMMRWCWACGII